MWPVGRPQKRNWGKKIKGFFLLGGGGDIQNMIVKIIKNKKFVSCPVGGKICGQSGGLKNNIWGKKIKEFSLGMALVD